MRRPLYWSSPRLLLFLRLGVENTGRQTTNDLDTVAAEIRKTAHGVDDKVEDTQGVTQEGDAAMDVDDVRNTVQDIGTSGIGGTQVAPNQSSTGDRSKQDFLEWLCPPDPSINYNIARDAHHRGTAVWFTESSIFRNWKNSGSLLWVYGKRTSPFGLRIFVLYNRPPIS